MLYPNREKAVCQRVPAVLLAGKTAYTSRNLLHRRHKQKPEEHSPKDRHELPRGNKSGCASDRACSAAWPKLVAEADIQRLLHARFRDRRHPMFCRLR
jgi:hypothetical protein